MIYLAACHCEALGFAYETALAPEAWPVRACGCRFCRAHSAAMTSDPTGSLTLQPREPDQLTRYRFGTQQADFWLCKRCGVFLAAISGDGELGVINTRALIDPLPLVSPTAMSFDGEAPDARVGRWRQRWTPVR